MSDAMEQETRVAPAGRRMLRRLSVVLPLDRQSWAWAWRLGSTERS